MSSERTNNTSRPPLKPTLSSTRTARTPVTPRIAANNATPSTRSTASRPSPTVRSEPPTPRVKQVNNDILANGNVTPRSSARTARVSSISASPPQSVTPNNARPKSGIVTSPSERSWRAGSVGSNGGMEARARISRPKSLLSDSGSNIRMQSPLVASPGLSDLGQKSPDESTKNRFFHASDAPRQEPVPKQVVPKKAKFFHADGKQEEQRHEVVSPVLSAISDQRSSRPWIRSENASNPSRSPPMLSPALSALSGTSPFFATATGQSSKPRSPSPSKENIHLSYRKGVSQIIGTRPLPTPRSTTSSADVQPALASHERAGSLGLTFPNITTNHRSPSPSSIDSDDAHSSRRRSVTTAGLGLSIDPAPSPLAHEVKAATVPRTAKPPNALTSIDTSLEAYDPAPEPTFSPTKNVSELAAEARRERKLLDLEISNSSLMAINASLEREVRRQKVELKRFRRLSRAGRFSYAPVERMARLSGELSAVGEEDEDDDMFGLPPGLSVIHDDFSDDDESLVSSAEPMSPSAQSRRESDRLAKDEKRLQVDLAKHKELLVQSQAMNQSIKRCMYATEDMIKEAKKALEYIVRVDEVKLGGRVLSSHEDDDESHELEIEDDSIQDNALELDQARRTLDVWAGVGRPSAESSEGGDRDSGIDVDRPAHASLPLRLKSGNASDSGRPPDNERHTVASADGERSGLL